jgi:putative transposase
MSRLFMFTEERIERIKPVFPKERGVNRADDRRVLSGTVYVI